MTTTHAARRLDLADSVARPAGDERLFRSFVDHSLGLVSLLSREGTILYANPSHRGLLGYAPSELSGRCVFDFVHPDDVPLVERTFTTGERMEVRVRHADGSWRLFEATGSDLRHDPAIGGVMVNATDITARRQLDDERRSEMRVSDALARIGQELMRTLARPVLLDQLCRIAAETLGCEASATLLRERRSRSFLPVAAYGRGRRFADLASSTHGAIAAATARLATETVVEADIPNEEAPASEQTRCLCIALKRANRVTGILLVGRIGNAKPFSSADRTIAEGISQIASIALENARLVEELEHANRIKSDFVATMSHELRTPLHIILGYLSLIAEGDFGALSDDQREVLRLVGRNANTLLDLVQDTLDLSRLERESLPLHLCRVEAGELLSGLEQDMQTMPRNPAVAVTWQCEPGLPAMCTDIVKLKIVLRNLISNGLKFTPAGSLVVAARASGEGVELSVADTGIGIPRAEFARIFEPFTQLGATSTRQYGGVGMGLYIARRLTDLLGGHLTVTSNVGEGSTFKVWVPTANSTTVNDNALPSSPVRNSRGASL